MPAKSLHNSIDSMANLPITIYAPTQEEKDAQETYNKGLEASFARMTPLYKRGKPFSEEGTQKLRDLMRNGGGEWPALKRLDDLAQIPFPSRSGYVNLVYSQGIGRLFQEEVAL